MAKLIDSGVVEQHQKVGNQRRVLRSAVTRWQEAERSRQAKALQRLSKDLDEEIFSSCVSLSLPMPMPIRCSRPRHGGGLIDLAYQGLIDRKGTRLNSSH